MISLGSVKRNKNISPNVYEALPSVVEPWYLSDLRNFIPGGGSLPTFASWNHIVIWSRHIVRVSILRVRPDYCR